jgi:hypothetical protein
VSETGDFRACSKGNKTMSITQNSNLLFPFLLTRRMRVAFKMAVEQLQCLWGERRSSFPFLGRFHADKIRQVVLAGFVPRSVTTH